MGLKQLREKTYVCTAYDCLFFLINLDGFRRQEGFEPLDSDWFLKTEIWR